MYPVLTHLSLCRLVIPTASNFGKYLSVGFAWQLLSACNVWHTPTFFSLNNPSRKIVHAVSCFYFFSFIKGQNEAVEN